MKKRAKQVKQAKANKKSNEKVIANLLNKSLVPAAYTFSVLRKIIRKAKKTAPLVYDELEQLLKSNIVIPDKKSRNGLKVPDLDKMSDIITANIVRKLPNVDESHLKEIAKDKTSKSFMEFLTKSFGAAGQEKDYTLLGKEKLFKNVLVANRGEIALRIIRACKELGIKVVVVYSAQDKDSLAVKFADKAYSIGSSSVSYLDIKKIISISKKAEVDAIHPGYGFLAENADFAKLCEKNKIKFIGPSSKTIKTLGEKVKAKHYVKKAAVLVIEGTKVLKNLKQAKKAVKKIRYPIIFKAAAGGGGKGMRIVKNEDEIENAFTSAQNEAKLSFGDKAVYIEKYVEDPRHIEFQVLSDKYGNVIHLGERECSIQRRHQKLIEEAPSPALDDELREQMGNAAVRAVSAVKYEGAGTVEFLLDKNNNFYFIEVNTRIQVEHAITEIITGVDLVKEQVKLAAGAKLAYSQEDINIDGHAIECRINAEDPLCDFCPSIGTVTNYLSPVGSGIRVSSICHAGYKISPHFDSLISLLVCSGKTREEALARMRVALDQYIIEGVETTIPFHKAVLSNNNFIKGKITTSFIDTEKIIEKIKKEQTPSIGSLSPEDRIMIVTKAVNEYLRKNHINQNNKPNAWAIASRQEAMNQNIEENF